MSGLIDGLLLFLNFGQIGNYSKSLFDNLIKYKNIDFKIIKDYEINSSLYCNNSIELLIDRANNNLSNLSRHIKSNDISFYHCLNNGFSIPKNFDFNYIMNVSNLTPLFFEDLCSDYYLNNFFNKFPYSILKSNSIICPSISCKNELLKNFSIPEDNISVSYGCISDFFNKSDKFMSSVYIKSKFNIDDEFIIFYGDFNEKKCLDKAIFLFSKMKLFFPNLYFLICSNEFKNTSYLDKLKNLSKSLGVFDYILYLYNISIIDKVNLFNNALCFIDLSVYENVNLNIVEAFKCHIPIICSSISLYKEYFGDLCFYYDSDIDYFSVINYIENYSLHNLDYVDCKFNRKINLDILCNIYNKFT